MDKKSRMEKSKAYRNDKYVKSWLVGLSERTQANYLEEFSEWYAFMGITPTQMIENTPMSCSTISFASNSPSTRTTFVATSWVSFNFIIFMLFNR
jgi:hypothetical protein